MRESEYVYSDFRTLNHLWREAALADLEAPLVPKTDAPGSRGRSRFYINRCLPDV